MKKKKSRPWWQTALNVVSFVAWGVIALRRGAVGGFVGAFVAVGFGQSILLGVLVGAVLGVVTVGWLDEWLDYFWSKLFPRRDQPARLETQPVSAEVPLGKGDVGQQISIARPLREVFRYVADFEHHPEWKVGVAKVKRLSLGPTTLGTRFQQHYDVIGRAGPSVLEITEWRIDEKIAYRFEPSGPHWESQVVKGYYTFAPAQPPQAGTIVAHVVCLKPDKGVTWIKQPYRLMVSQDLIQLKQKLEGLG